MAATVTANLTLVTDGESDSANWTNTDGTDTEIFIQNTGSESWYVAKNSTPTATFDAYAANGNVALDMSATDTHLYFWAYSTVAQLVATKANSGLTLRIDDSAANFKEWKIAGSDTWDGRWTCFIQDINATADASSGTLDYTDIRDIKFYVNSTGTGYRNSTGNYWFDVIRYGTGLTVTGTAFNFADIAVEDELVANKYGVLQYVDGVLFCQGRLTLGDATGSVTTTFSSTNEALYFPDAPVSTGLYQLNAVASGTATTTLTIDGLVTKTVGTSRCDVDFSDTDLGASTVDGSTFIDMGLVTIDANVSVDSSKFNNCLQIDPSTATFEGNTISNYVGTEGGSLLWPGGSSVQDCIFDNNLKSIEVTQTTTQSYTDLVFIGEDNSTKQSTHLNNGGTSITINKGGTSNPLYYTATGGGTVTFAASVPITITVKDSDNVAITTANVRVEELDGTLVVQGTVNGSGIYSTTYGGSTPLNIRLKVRSSSTGENRYVPIRTNGTIESSTGLVSTVTMTDDSIVEA